MNREKQIEEMAKVLCEHCKELWGEDFRQDKLPWDIGE